MQLFNVGEVGYVLLIRLVENRVQYDLNLETESLHKTSNANNRREKNSNLFDNVMRPLSEKQEREIASRLERKKQWLEVWMNKAKKAVLFNPILLGKSIDELLMEFNSKPENKPKLFLILQLAVLTQPYQTIGHEFPADKATGLSELQHNEGIEYIAMRCGFSAKTGGEITSNLQKIIRDMNNDAAWLAVFTLAGAAALAVAAGFAAPAIAAAIGGAMGLAGAAAGTAGLAFLGGGAIVAGGFGMAGGLTVLVGGGALLGAGSGAAIHQILNGLPKDQFTAQVALLVSYVQYLATDLALESEEAGIAAREVCLAFVDFKHNCEIDFLYNESTKEALANINTLHQAYILMSRYFQSLHIKAKDTVTQNELKYVGY